MYFNLKKLISLDAINTSLGFLNLVLDATQKHCKILL